MICKANMRSVIQPTFASGRQVMVGTTNSAGEDFKMRMDLIGTGRTIFNYPGPLPIHPHFTPTSSSWMNLVERFFRDLSEDVVRDGSFTSTKQLTEAILGYLAERNLYPVRYEWRAKGAEILKKIQLAGEKLATDT